MSVKGPEVKVRFNIDRGGTFTDVYAEVLSPTGEVDYRVLKLLSEDPGNYENAPREAIRRILNDVAQTNLGPKDKIPTRNIEWIRMGTTVATNALLERNAAETNEKYKGNLPPPRRVALVTTKGFGDLLTIGNQSRPNIFDLTVAKPELLFDKDHVIEVDERVFLRTDISPEEAQNSGNPNLYVRNGEVIEVKPLPAKDSDEYNALVSALKKPLESGVTSVAIVFLHSYCFPDHEDKVKEICMDLGYSYVSASSRLTCGVKAVARGHTSTVDAFLTPYLEAYIKGFKSGFDDSIDTVDVSFMKSDGGLCPVSNFTGFVSILSGPAGGVVGYSQTTIGEGEEALPVVGFDMGGTSTDVSRVEGKNYPYIQETELDGVFIQATQLDINTIAAGGGSVLYFKQGYMDVGPDSVGSDPGPVCYGKGSQQLAITDANFLLGRIVPKYFPFELDKEAVVNKFEEMRANILSAQPENKLSLEEVAHGFLHIANAKMSEAIKKVTEARGYDVTKHVLSVFGGAGPQHACAIARSLGIQHLVVNRFSSLLSAYGLGLADEKEEIQVPCRVGFMYEPKFFAEIEDGLNKLSETIHERLQKRNFSGDRVEIQRILNMRYNGTDTILSIPKPENGKYEESFEAEYFREFGFKMPGNPIVVESLKVVGYGKSPHISAQAIPKSLSAEVTPEEFSKCYFSNLGWVDVPVFVLSKLAAGDKIVGPALIIDPKYFMTIVLDPECTALVDDTGNIHIHVPKLDKKKEEDSIVNRSLYIHRFMSIAEQMGVVLQRTAKSVNIKERLDFSCALFSHNGGLVANAPHLPVHLGAMAHAVKYQIETCLDWSKGEVILANHPGSGGSHLPDFTVITPVYYEGENTDPVFVGEHQVDLKKPIFYVASRAHHADIGGLTPGSMPPFSKTLVEEGAATKCLKIMKNGVFQTEAVQEFLQSPAVESKKLTGVSVAGARFPQDNIADLKAQIAANKRGIDLVLELIKTNGLGHVLKTMTEGFCHYYLSYLVVSLYNFYNTNVSFLIFISSTLPSFSFTPTSIIVGFFCVSHRPLLLSDTTIPPKHQFPSDH
eukprot:TRINITY_DN1923_c0_g1_i2.p1 TRINITY_DN1923_c0_g1~~TRINITY_DN1923_c0_g1_i2.p1  ORF type:complete len:1064 (-),score=222.77 TRINITY_DN1923_c0_g1_i2:18-3209(-)